jgi:putative YhbY family RNA-binding protein
VPDKWHATTGYTGVMPSVDPVMRRALRARAHHLHPVVAVGQHGLTPEVLREIDRALKAHELIKVRVFSDDRRARGALLDEICAALDAAPVQHLGKLLVLWRAEPPEAETSKPVANPRTGRRHGASSQAAAAQPRPAKGRGALALEPTARGGASRRRGAAGQGVASGRAHGTHGTAAKAGKRHGAQGVQAKGPAPRGNARGTAAKAPTGGPPPRARATSDRMASGPANPRAPRGVPRATMPRRRRRTGGTGLK